ncbi:MAG: hypothetical protein D8M59_06155 [Planctomycetes bacterium]|nr:hypothetical protein [Planctomycetota bacterium]NOG55080.1 hypothetical protein [Planctomycetota bacterium]
MKKVLALMAGAVLCGSAAADMNAIGPFTGDYQEDFNTDYVVFQPCLSWRTFGGTSDWCTPGNSGTHTTSGWGFYCTVYARSSPYLYGSAGGYTNCTFDMEMGKFGGYFENHTNVDGCTLNFYDVDGNLHASEYVDNPACDGSDWVWYGFETTDTGFVSVDIIGEGYGAFVLMEDMEASEFAGGGFDLAVTGDCPGTMEACATGANAGDKIVIIYSFNYGSAGPVPGCPSLFTDLASPVVAGSGAADASGTYCKSGKVPQNACGRVKVQAINRSTCEKSAVVEI